jgi:hypothetical protein
MADVDLWHGARKLDLNTATDLLLMLRLMKYSGSMAVRNSNT